MAIKIPRTDQCLNYEHYVCFKAGEENDTEATKTTHILASVILSMIQVRCRCQAKDAVQKNQEVVYCWANLR